MIYFIRMKIRVPSVELLLCGILLCTILNQATIRTRGVSRSFSAGNISVTLCNGKFQLSTLGA